MAEENFLKAVASSKTIPQLTESLGINDNDYVVVFSANLQKPVKVKKSNVQFPTTSFVRGETIVDFPNTGVLSSLYLENSTNKLYKWTGTAYKWLFEDELATINAYIATKLDKGTYTGDAVNLLAEAKAYSDSLANGLKWKDPVQLATTANVVLSGEQTIDGVLTSASRILVKNQTAGAENGIYTTSATGWVRTADADTGAKLANATAKVEQGSANANKFFTCNNSTITLGTTSIVFVSMGSVQDHNSTTGLQGGTTAEFYHLSLANFNKVSALPAVSEATANKAVDFTIVDDTKYPTTKAVKDEIAKYDDVIGEVNKTAFPTVGKIDVLYIDRTTLKLWVWDEAITDYNTAKLTASITAQDIIAALGYTPANDAEVVKGVRNASGVSVVDEFGVARLPDFLRQAINNFNFNSISIPHDSEPMILSGGVGAFDETIREVGNVVFNDTTNQYIILYSGALINYTQEDVFIGMATSPDGKTWTKIGKIINTPSEDPYLVIHNNQYYVYVEKKGVDAHLDIELFISSDLVNWVSQGVVLEKSLEAWETRDVSSPTVIVENGVWYLFYEGRETGAPARKTGSLGLATSTDGINFTKYQTSPLISARAYNGDIQWAWNFIPDDIIKLGDTYYMLFHSHNSDTYVQGILFSNDLINWSDYLHGWLDLSFDTSGTGVMFFKKGGILQVTVEKDSHLYAGVLTSKLNDNLFVYEKTTNEYPILPLNLNQVIEANITSDETFEISTNLSAKKGGYITLKNNSEYVLTIIPVDGIVLTGRDTVVIKTKEEVRFLYKGFNVFDVEQELINTEIKDFVRVRSGNGEIWRVHVNDVGSLVTSLNPIVANYISRVEADGGSYYPNGIVSTEIYEAEIEESLPILLLTPNAVKTGKIYSVLPENGTGDATVSRNSTADYVDENLMIKTALADVLRIDHSTGKPKILAEGEATNLFTYSNDFGNATWQKFGVSITNSQTSPSGANDAVLLTATDGTARLYRNLPAVADNTTYSFSFYAKAGTAKSFGMRMGGKDGGFDFLIYNLENGTVKISGAFVDKSIGRISKLNNGWYRCTIIRNLGTGTSTPYVRFIDYNNSDFSNGKNLFIWKSQLEEGSNPTSSILTVATPVTRPADVVTITVPSGVTEIIETIDGVENNITTIPLTYQLPEGNINKIEMK